MRFWLTSNSSLSAAAVAGANWSIVGISIETSQGIQAEERPFERSLRYRSMMEALW
jgi:hypothetical protein